MLKKKTILCLLAFIMCMGSVSMQPTRTQAATKAWQDAYADVLLSPQGFYKTYGSENQAEYNRYKPYFTFSLQDLDNNGIPELIVRWDMSVDGYTCDIYTYSKGIKELGKISLRDEFYISGNSKFPGLFYCAYAYNGSEAYGYVSIKNNKLKDEIFLQKQNEVIIKNNKTLNAEMGKAKLLPKYSISNINIADVIYNYGKKATTTPHPYATALRDYIKNTYGETSAYLVDINGDGIMEMLASRSSSYVGERLFYMYNGEVRTYDFDLDIYGTIFISANNHLISSGSGFYRILKLEKGEVKEETILRANLLGINDVNYYQNDKQISKSAYDKLLKKYGISENEYKKLFVIKNNQVVYTRKNDTIKVLTMTADVKVTGIKLNKTSLTLAKGKTYALKATISPEKATTKAVKWTSSNTKVATVDNKGNVKAIGKGTAIIKVTATDGSNVQKTCKITVK